jgi:hypothetical protein
MNEVIISEFDQKCSLIIMIRGSLEQKIKKTNTTLNKNIDVKVNLLVTNFKNRNNVFGLENFLLKNGSTSTFTSSSFGLFNIIDEQILEKKIKESLLDSDRQRIQTLKDYI